jgi:hypothetical protein
VPELLKPLADELAAHIAAELALQPQTQPIDMGMVNIHAFMEAEARRRMEYSIRTGGLWTSRGSLKKGGREFLNLVYRIHESAKVLGIGAAPRAGVLRDMADARLGSLEVHAAQERLRAKYPIQTDA